MSYFNIDPKPENFVHGNGIKGISKVIYRTKKYNLFLKFFSVKHDTFYSLLMQETKYHVLLTIY